MSTITTMSVEDLKELRNYHSQQHKECPLHNVATLLFKYEGTGATDGDLMKALDKKYDALLDKLALEALEKQMGDAEWKRWDI